MKLLLAMVRYELKLQLRSARFRIAAIGYAAACALPPGLLYFELRHRADEALGGASYLAQTLQVQPYMTAIMVALVAGNRSSAEALRENWSVLAASPMSNLGFVVRRWLALLTITVPLSLVPLLTALIAALAAGHESLDPAAWLGSWGLRILPLTVVTTAYWLAWVTVTGTEIAALITTFVGFPLLVSAANQFLLRYRLTFAGYLEWFGYRDLFYGIAYLAGKNRYHPGLAATEAPYDLAAAAAWMLPRGAFTAALAALGLGIAAAFARRTRRDLRPRPVPENHQLRTFLRQLNRQRELYAPDGGLGLAERLAMVAGVVVFGLCLTLGIGRQLHFHDLAAERYRAEIEGDFEPLPAEVKAVSWSVRGEIDGAGRVDLEAVSRFHNHGPKPVDALAFSLNPDLEIARLHASRQVEAVRAWDRLQLRLDPPLAGGESLDLELDLTGVPGTIDFSYGRRRAWIAFAANHEVMQKARFPREVADLSRSWQRRAASPRRVVLRAMDLGPVPRYTPWTLTRPGESTDDSDESVFGRVVPSETARAMVDLELDLAAPPEWFLADTCGQASRIDQGRARLQGACHTSLTELRVAGGRLIAIESGGSGGTGGNVTFAALPPHREVVERQLGSLARVAALSDRAWPGMPGLNGLAAIEWPAEFHVRLRHQMGAWNDREPELIGRLLLIPERRLLDTEPLTPEGLVAQLLSRDLLERRQLAEDQDVFFRHFFRALMIRRMGLDGDGGATVSGKPWVRTMLQAPILTASPRQGIIWRRRLPAVLAEIESRAGGDTFYAAIESFLAAGGEEPGTLEELLAEIETRSGISLERTYEDHFLGDAQPILELMDVRSQRLDEGWRVEGKVHNRGTGQAVCPVIVKTEIHELQLTVTVDSESSSPFATRALSRPHTVLLDPNRTCYRWLLKTSAVLERANLLE